MCRTRHVCYYKMKYKQIIVRGKVQGTGFREFVRKKVKDLVGFVRNTKEGTVEIVVAGDEKNIASLIKECGKGPFLADVKNVEEKEIELDDLFDSFFIKFS